MTPDEKRAYHRAYMKEYNKKYPERRREYARISRKRNPMRIKAEHAKWRRQLTPEQALANRERSRDWRLANPERFKERQDIDRLRIKAQVIQAYGGKCECCSEATPAFLSIDHINNDGVSHRKQLNGRNIYRWLRANGFPKENFRLLCMNCNFARGAMGYCPHQAMLSLVEEM